MKFLPIIIHTKGVGAKMKFKTIAELLQALSNENDQNKRMEMLNNNMELINAVRDYDPNATNADVEKLTEENKQLTEERDKIKAMYDEVFWKGLKGGNQQNNQDSNNNTDTNSVDVDGDGDGGEGDKELTLETLNVGFAE